MSRQYETIAIAGAAGFMVRAGSLSLQRRSFDMGGDSTPDAVAEMADVGMGDEGCAGNEDVKSLSGVEWRR